MVTSQEMVRPPISMPAHTRYTTIVVATLCLTVAIGSAMPTGDLPGQARDLGVPNELIYLSITLFVVGFGVGPLLFAPREWCRVSTVSRWENSR